jgi:hypothetical protein
VIEAVKDGLRSPGVSVEVGPSAQQRVEMVQTISEALSGRLSSEKLFDRFPQPLASLLGNDGSAHHASTAWVPSHSDVMPQKSHRLCHRSDERFRFRELQSEPLLELLCQRDFLVFSDDATVLDGAIASCIDENDEVIRVANGKEDRPPTVSIVGAPP